MALGKVNAMLADGIGAAIGTDSEKMKLSPVQYDYMIKAYLGWIGTVIQTTSYYANGLMKPGEMPALRLDDVVWVGNYLKDLPTSPATSQISTPRLSVRLVRRQTSMTL